MIFPTSWKYSIVVPILKAEVWNGDLEFLRFITLLESSRKILSKILMDHLSSVLGTYTTTTDSLHLFNTLCNQAESTSSQLIVASLDLRRAYDSVPYASLRKRIVKLKTPNQNITSIMNTL